MTPLRLLLLDLDDVLLFSRGYRASLRNAVAYFGRRLGYADVPLPEDDIDAFEAFGLTAEWDSATVCVSLLLAKLWERLPDHPIPDDSEWRLPPGHHMPVPEFRALIDDLSPLGTGRDGPLKAVEGSLLERCPYLSIDQRRYLQELLGSTRIFERSPVHRLIQEFNLGSGMFHDYYGAKPMLAVESSLRLHDRPRLDQAARNRLQEWSLEPDHAAVIFTNRPSTSPDGAFDTPEAELGLDASGLSGLPVAGGGGLEWIGLRRGLRSGDLLKPSPVHALTALRLALGDTLEDSLESAAELALDGHADRGWMPLDGSELHVFDDSAKGLRSTASAVALLKPHGITIKSKLYGVSDSPVKRAALAEAGGSLFDDIQTALAKVEDLEEIAR
jgi:hypothetical protein